MCIIAPWTSIDISKRVVFGRGWINLFPLRSITPRMTASTTRTKIFEGSKKPRWQMLQQYAATSRWWGSSGLRFKLIHGMHIFFILRAKTGRSWFEELPESCLKPMFSPSDFLRFLSKSLLRSQGLAEAWGGLCRLFAFSIGSPWLRRSNDRWAESPLCHDSWRLNRSDGYFICHSLLNTSQKG